jgi:hypothetical protein
VELTPIQWHPALRPPRAYGHLFITANVLKVDLHYTTFAYVVVVSCVFDLHSTTQVVSRWHVTALGKSNKGEFRS